MHLRSQPIFSPDAATGLPGPQWMRTRRTAAAERFAALSLPTEQEEIWRYSRISQLDLDRFAPAAAPEGQGSVPDALAPVVEAAGELAALVVVRNGTVSHVTVNDGWGERGLWVGDVADADDGDDVLGSVAQASTDAFTELNAAFLPGAACVRIRPGLAVDKPVLILHWFDGDGTAAFTRTIVQAGSDSELTVIEHVASPDVLMMVDPIVELDIGDAARVRYLTVQDLGPRVWQIGYQASRVGRDATLSSSVVALGGDYARVRTDSCINGKGGSSYLTAVYFADGDRMHDFRTLQDHAAPSSTSDLLFKGAVQDHGRSV